MNEDPSIRTPIRPAHITILVLINHIEVYKPYYWLFEGVNKIQYSPSSMASILRNSSKKAILKILDTKITDKQLLNKEPYLRTFKKDSVDIKREYDKLEAIIDE